MVTFVCTTCGTLNYAHEGQYYAPCCRCGTWFYLQQQQQNPYRYSHPASYSYQQPQAPASMPEPAEYIPKVPANNRYAGHDKVIAKMAKDYAEQIFRYIKAVPWRPVTKDTRVVNHSMDIWIGCNDFSAASATTQPLLNS